MEGFDVLFIKQDQYFDICFCFVVLAEFSEASLLEFIEDVAILKIVHQTDKLSNGKVSLLRHGILIDDVKTKSLSHVLPGVEPIGILREQPDHVDVVLISLLLGDFS